MRSTMLGMFGLIVGMLFIPAQADAEVPKSSFAAQADLIFMPCLADEFKELTPYAVLPDKNVALVTKEYWPLLQGVEGWLKRSLKPEYVPERIYLSEHLLLIPKLHSPLEVDTAYLSFQIEDRSIRMVLTCDPTSQIMIFVSDPFQPEPVDEACAEEMHRELLDTFFQKELIRQTPKMALTPARGKMGNRIYSGKVLMEDWDRPPPTQRCFLSDQESCLVIRYVRTVAATEILGRTWFEGKEGKPEPEPTPTPKKNLEVKSKPGELDLFPATKKNSTAESNSGSPDQFPAPSALPPRSRSAPTAGSIPSLFGPSSKKKAK